MTGKPITTKREEVLHQFVDDAVTQTWNDGSTLVYRARKSGDNIFIAIDNEPAFVNWARLPETKDDKYAGPQFHVVNDKGEWLGGSVTIYGPEVKDYGEPTIVGAEINCSSARCESLDAASAQATMLMWAIRYAEAWEDDVRPRLEDELEKTKRQLVESRAAARRERDETARRWSYVLEHVSDGTQVRITTEDKQTPTVGTVAAIAAKRIDVKLTYREKPVTLFFHSMTKLEVKTSNGRFTEVPLS